MFKKHRELILYLIFGVLTTLVDLLAFIVFDVLLTERLYLLSNALAWIIAVAFAFVTNKLLVFASAARDGKTLLREITEFVGARVFSLCTEELGLFLLVEFTALGSLALPILGFDLTGRLIAKLILAVIVVILNYVFSKFIIFKKPKSY